MKIRVIVQRSKVTVPSCSFLGITARHCLHDLLIVLICLEVDLERPGNGIEGDPLLLHDLQTGNSRGLGSIDAVQLDAMAR